MLRICRDCGLEAHNEKGLENFKKDKLSKHGRQNICKECSNKRSRQDWQQRMLDDRVYLRAKFNQIRQRCYNPRRPNYPLYGGRGIAVCQEWLDDPEAFIDWALVNGWTRSLQIDRIDNEGAYAPDNCRWVTRYVQHMNRRDTTTDLEKGTRICWKCGEEKSLEDFHRNKGKLSGRMYTCIECMKKLRRSYVD